MKKVFGLMVLFIGINLGATSVLAQSFAADDVKKIYFSAELINSKRLVFIQEDRVGRYGKAFVFRVDSAYCVITYGSGMNNHQAKAAVDMNSRNWIMSKYETPDERNANTKHFYGKVDYLTTNALFSWEDGQRTLPNDCFFTSLSHGGSVVYSSGGNTIFYLVLLKNIKIDDIPFNTRKL